MHRAINSHMQRTFLCIRQPAGLTVTSWYSAHAAYVQASMPFRGKTTWGGELMILSPFPCRLVPSVCPQRHLFA
jgi:hypothetical protein